MTSANLAPPEIDRRIEELSDLLETQARANYKLATEGAEAEAKYRQVKAQEYLKVRDELSGGGQRPTEGLIEAYVTTAIAEEHRDYLVKQAKHEAARDAMFASRARLDAMRTLSAGNREGVKG